MYFVFYINIVFCQLILLSNKMEREDEVLLSYILNISVMNKILFCWLNFCYNLVFLLYDSTYDELLGYEVEHGF